ncbi:MAG TPA: DNA polymerase I [Acidimicrobiales bacterium]|nr:DNA polymerase I [Acidimicrobiales bacterium]
MATFLLLDGHSLAYRAWFALQETNMATASGQQTQAVFGFVSMLTKLVDDFRPDGMAVAFDRKEPTFRDEIVPDYKAGRPPTPEPLVEQFDIIRNLVGTLGIPVVDRAGFEADDVLGTLARDISRRGDDVIVVTGDRDTYQLVEDPHVKVLYNRRGVTDYVLYDEAGIVERTGVRPSDYPLYAAMRGDKSDNIIGVPGIGEKTAARLINDYGDIEGIYAHVETLTPKLRATLIESEPQLRRNLLLTPIVCDVPLDVTDEELVLGGVDREALTALLDLLELRTLKERLLAVLDSIDATKAPVTDSPKSTHAVRPVVLIDTAESAARAILALESMTPGAVVAIEASWQGTPGRSTPTAIAFLGAELDHVDVLGERLLSDAKVTKAIAKLLGQSDGQHPLYGARVKELMRALLALGVDIRSLEIDVAVAAYLIDPALGQESLEGLAQRFGVDTPINSNAPLTQQLGFALEEGSEEDSLAPLAERLEAITLLGTRLRAELEETGALSLWEEIELPLIRVLAKMEWVGIAVDVKQLQTINEELTEECRRLEGEIHQLAGEPFNLNSPTQLRVVLYDNLGLRPGKKTKTGYSTDAQTLERLRGQHPIIDALLSFREVEKLRSTYGTGLLAEVASDGRIHASFRQTVARTGRLSSDAPNLHNIPVRSDGGRRFRKAFVPAPGCQLLVADYNQIELRVIAHLAKDPGLIKAFANGQDIHATTAAGIFGVPVDEVTSAQRAKAKMVSYGLAYGMEAFGLANRLGIGVDEASEILSQYFIAFPSVRAYMDATVQEAKRRGYTETERGRRRYLPELNSDNFRVRQAAERQAMNAGIQGLAADIFKAALVNLDRVLEEARFSSRIVLQVHDEILLEATAAEHDAVHALTLSAMNDAYPLVVPLEVNIAWGSSWADAKSG